MAFLEAIPAIAEAAGPMLSKLADSGIGSKVMQSIGQKSAGQVIGNVAQKAANSFHPISNSGPVPGSQPMDQPGYNNLSQAQFSNSV